MANSFKDKAEKKRLSSNNPAMMFISQPGAEKPSPRVASEPAEREPARTAAGAEELQRLSGRNTEGHATTRAQIGREAKTRRLQLLIQPSLYEAVKERAEAEGLSINETISELLRRALEE